MAPTGHSSTHRVQSMHSTGSMTRKLGPSWKQSTGHTSTQSVCLQLMQFSVTTWVTCRPPDALGTGGMFVGTKCRRPDLDQFARAAPGRNCAQRNDHPHWSKLMIRKLSLAAVLGAVALPAMFMASPANAATCSATVESTDAMKFTTSELV